MQGHCTSSISTVELEIWNAVLGCEGEYEVSSLGRVKSLARVRFRKDGTPNPIKERILKTYGGGPEKRAMVQLRGDNRRERAYVHRLVLESFVGPCPENMEGCHNDGNPHNNLLDNLRWDTHQNNQLDRHKHGTMRTGTGVGQLNPRATMTDEEAHHVRQGFKSFNGTRTEYAATLGIPFCRVNDLISGRSWKHLPM